MIEIYISLQEAAKVTEAKAAAATARSQAAARQTQAASKAVGGLLGKSLGKAKAASSAVRARTCSATVVHAPPSFFVVFFCCSVLYLLQSNHV